MMQNLFKIIGDRIAGHVVRGICEVKLKTSVMVFLKINARDNPNKFAADVVAGIK